MITYLFSMLFVLSTGVGAVVWQIWCAERKHRIRMEEWQINRVVPESLIQKQKEK